MYRHMTISDSDTDYSETDISFVDPPRRPAGITRRRSVSRQRPSREHHSTTYLSPVQDVRVQRSASTGGRRPHHHSRTRERSYEQEVVAPPPPPATNLFVDIKNDSRNRSSNKSRRKEQKTTTLMPEEEESEDETRLRSHRRPRASRSVSREAPPRHSSPFHRDYDLVIDQRLLEKNDARQDMELYKQQLEIDRLERELARRRDSQDHRLHKEEEHWYEDEISDRLKRLERYEKQQRMEEERHKIEYRQKITKYEAAEREAAERERLEEEHRNREYRQRIKKFEEAEHHAAELQKLEEERRNAEYRQRIDKFEEAERLAAEKEEVRAKIREEKLREIQRKIEEDEERERVKKEIRDEEMRRMFEEQERQQKEAMMKAAAVEEWKLNEERRKIAEQKAKERRDNEFKDRLKVEFGYSEEEIEDILKGKKAKEGEKEKEKEKEKKKEKEKEKEKEKVGEKKDDEKELEHSRTTWIKVHRKHLLPDTLMAYRLPWDWDDLDPNYIIIKQYISEDFQEELFGHTRRLRDNKLVTQTSSSLTELKVNDRKKDKMFLVRKKSPNRRAWIFT